MIPAASLPCRGARTPLSLAKAIEAVLTVEQIQEIAGALLNQTTIPAVRAQQHLLDELTTDDWWQDITLPMLESMRR